MDNEGKWLWLKVSTQDGFLLFLCTRATVFSDSGVQNLTTSLCGWYWMNSVEARVQGYSDATGIPCFCNAGFHYLDTIEITRIDRTVFPASVVKEPVKVNTCVQCPGGRFSLGGDTSVTFCEGLCLSLDTGWYCNRGVVAKCPSSPGLGCARGEIIPSLGVRCDFSTDGGGTCELEDCDPGYYCPGDFMQYACPSGHECVEGGLS